MKIILFIILVVLGLGYGLIFAAVPQSEITIQGAQVTIRGGYVDLGVKELDKVVVSTTTGQCIGILCGVTYTN